MTPTQRRLALDFILRRISEAQFVAEFPFDSRSSASYLRGELTDAIDSRDSNAVEMVLLLSGRFKTDAELADLLRQLCNEDWHTQHENLASVFQRLKDPLAVDGLYHMATTRYAYLEYDEASALAVKCIWALFAINTPSSIAKLKLLCKSESEIIASNARDRLKALNQLDII